MLDICWMAYPGIVTSIGKLRFPQCFGVILWCSDSVGQVLQTLEVNSQFECRCAVAGEHLTKQFGSPQINHQPSYIKYIQLHYYILPSFSWWTPKKNHDERWSLSFHGALGHGISQCSCRTSRGQFALRWWALANTKGVRCPQPRCWGEISQLPSRDGHPICNWDPTTFCQGTWWNASDLGTLVLDKSTGRNMKF